jgi:16S rRNA processing protein RimM
VTHEPPAALTLARVLRPWGRRGQVAAEILTDFPERLSRLGRVWLADSASRREATVVSCRLPATAGRHRGPAVFQFAGVTSIDEAEKLRGLEIQVPLNERASLPSGRYYISDLVGCAVWEEGAPAALGLVREVQPLAETSEAPEAWVLAVETAPGSELLIPLAAEICVAIDLAARRIVVRLPEGLRELNA